MKLLKPLIIFLVVLELNACAMLPYENKYSCHLKNNYGKCISVNSAYKEAVTGESQGDYMVPDSQKPWGKKRHVENKQGNRALKQNPYETYRDRTYKKLSGLIDEPQMPMLKPTKTVRTLVVAYSPDMNKETLYMPRYVYSIIKDPQWVLGQYLEKNNELTAGIADSRHVEK